MTMNEYLEELEAGPEHDLAIYYIREHRGCHLNDVIRFMEEVEAERNVQQV